MYVFRIKLHPFVNVLGLQRDDGLAGPLIIHQSKTNDVHAHRYDHDRIMFLNDWAHLTGADGFLRDYFVGSSMYPDTILVNGYGKLNVPLTSNETSRNTPTAVFTVKKVSASFLDRSTSE